MLSVLDFHSTCLHFVHSFIKYMLWTYYVLAIKKKFQTWREIRGAVGAHSRECQTPQITSRLYHTALELAVCLPISLVLVF